MTLLLLAAWLPARFMTTGLQNARATKGKKTKKKGGGGQGSRVGTVESVSASDRKQRAVRVRVCDSVW